MHFPNKILALSIILLGLLVSCSTEFSLARNLQRHKNSVHILFSFPERIILSNSKVEVRSGLSIVEEISFFDSAHYSSDFVQYIDDTIFLRKFKSHLKNHITEMGFSYYENDDLKEFLGTEGTLYLVNFKQLEIEERWVPIHREEQFDTLVYEEDLWVNGISMNAWGDIAKVNDTVEIQKQLYYESILSDGVEGMFFENQWNGEVHFQYLLDTLYVNQLGELESQSAEDFSINLIDHIINKEIRDQMNYQEGLKPNHEWYLSPGSGRLLPKM